MRAILLSYFLLFASINTRISFAEILPSITSLPVRQNALYLDTSDQELLQILDDPSERVSELFKVPSGMRSMVGFWFLIYTKYSLYQTLIYDQTHKNIIYQVIDNRDLFQKGSSPVVIEITGKQRLSNALREYKTAIQKLITYPKTSFAKNSAGERVLKLWGRKSSSEWKKIFASIKYQSGQRDRIMQGIHLSERFIPVMEKIFKSQDIPSEITRIPLVESSFIIKAQSKADAVGVWQFLERSAQEYLTVDTKNKIDERLSPIKSTYAAAKMFKRNYKILDDWGLAIIAYNHGVRNLIPIRKKYNGKQLSKLLTASDSGPLGFASKNYYAEFLALLHAEKYKEYIYGQKSKPEFEEVSIVKIKNSVSVFDLASLYNISIHDLKVYNPDIFDIKKRLPRGTRVVIPRKNGEKIVRSPELNKQLNEQTDRSISSEGDLLEIIEFIK